MSKVVHLRSEEKFLEETASLTTLCRKGATRCFVYHNPISDELHYFACVELGRDEFALYSHANNSESRSQLYHFEDFVSGGLPSAIDRAGLLLGTCWVPLSL